MKDANMKKIIGFISIFIIYSTLFTNYSLAAIPGCHCDDMVVHCYSDGCTRKSVRDDGTVDEYGLCSGEYKDYHFDTNSIEAIKHLCMAPAPCCLEVLRTGIPGACCWPERAACHPYFCSSITGDKQNCGWGWSFHDGMSNRSFGYWCTIGNSQADLKPIWGLPPGVPGNNISPTQASPTVIPPTNIPTTYISPTPIPTRVILPTTIPTQLNNSPTRPPLINPTQIPQSYPTAKPYLQPTNSELPISIGVGIFQASIKDSIANVKISIAKTAIASKKILDLPKYAGKKILSLDQHLEIFINELIGQIKRKVTGTISI